MHLISKIFLGEHAPRLHAYACMPACTSDTHVTHLQILATGLVTSCRSGCCVALGLNFEAAGDSVVRYFVFCVQLSASRASSHCKYDMGSLSWLNAETVERAPISLLIGRLVTYSTHGPFFGRLWYIHNIAVVSANHTRILQIANRHNFYLALYQVTCPLQLMYSCY